MANGNGGNGHGNDLEERVAFLEEGMRNLLGTIVVQNVSITGLRVQMGLQQADIDNLRDRVARLEADNEDEEGS